MLKRRIDELRREFGGRIMTSAVWEYCPEEFGELLDEVERLQLENDSLRDRIDTPCKGCGL